MGAVAGAVASLAGTERARTGHGGSRRLREILEGGGCEGGGCEDGGCEDGGCEGGGCESGASCARAADSGMAVAMTD